MPASPRLRGRHHHQQEQQSESEQDEKKEEEEEDGDNSARNDNSRFGGYDDSHIGVSQSSSTRDGSESLRHNSVTASSQTVARRASGGINSKRNPPVFPRAPSKLQSQGQQFRFNEVMSMLDCVFSHLPIGSYEWECIAAEHNENFPGKDQTGTSIWRKFSQLHKVKKPTGDPTCSPKVR